MAWELPLVMRFTWPLLQCEYWVLPLFYDDAPADGGTLRFKFRLLL